LGWAAAGVVVEWEEGGLGFVVLVVVIKGGGAGPRVSGLEAWRAADDAAFDGAVGGGGGGG
jgi:hypothetical protein